MIVKGEIAMPAERAVTNEVCVERRAACSEGVLKVYREKIDVLTKNQKATDQKVTATLVFVIVTLVAIIVKILPWSI